MVIFRLPNFRPFHNPYKSDMQGYYDRPGWATRPPVPANAKFREPWNWPGPQLSDTRVQHGFHDYNFQYTKSNTAYAKYLRVSRRPRYLGNASRNTFTSTKRLRCYRCGILGHIRFNCRVNLHKTYIR